MSASHSSSLRSLVLRLCASILMLAAVGGCDQIGLETPEKITGRLEAEAKAIGSACRHGGRAIEDCYTLNPKYSKAAIYSGWREMDEYMRENKLDVIKPVIPRNKPKKAINPDDSEPPEPPARVVEKPEVKASAPASSPAKSKKTPA